MTKIYIIFAGMCYEEITNKIMPDGRMIKTKEDAEKYYARNIKIVDAPDYVFPNWGYDEKNHASPFIEPKAPEGWAYDDGTGTFWNPYATRETERESLYRAQDGNRSKAERMVRLGQEVERYQVWISNIDAYCEAVRQTQYNTENFPLATPAYPALPELI